MWGDFLVYCFKMNIIGNWFFWSNKTKQFEDVTLVWWLWELNTLQLTQANEENIFTNWTHVQPKNIAANINNN